MLRSSSSSSDSRCRSGLSGRNSSNNCSARSNDAVSKVLPLNTWLQLRATSCSDNKETTPYLAWNGPNHTTLNSQALLHSTFFTAGLPRTLGVYGRGARKGPSAKLNELAG